MFVKNSIPQMHAVSIMDKSVDGILWVRLANKQDTSDLWNICVCYLPPHGSSRPVDAAAFCEELYAQMFSYHNQGEFLLMGDYSSRVGDRQEFIEGVDDLCEREIIDTKENAYSDIFVDFLVSANCVMLNGRDNIKHDYTFVSNRGISVPHSLLPHSQSIEIIRAKSLFTAAGCIGVVDHQRANIPDHSFLRWTIQQHTQVADPNADPHRHPTAA